MDWKTLLEKDINSEYFKKLEKFIKEEYKKHTVYPSYENIFRAFHLTHPDNLKIVILGQDPYHGKNQADGLAFSVPDGVKIPPSLKNIFRELKNDLGFEIPKSGNLEKWSKQGVLLLNTILTVVESKPLSHKNKGWEIFTSSVIKTISDNFENIIFILWGSHAQSKIQYIDEHKHYILKASHPSPYSASSGFFGCKHFSLSNKILRSINKQEIDWKL